MNYGLGIDTGGTYTDSVIIDLDTHELLSRSKSLTTRDDLVIGIHSSLDGLDKKLLPNVSLVSLSSTLATNAVVEGKSCRVGLISIGKKAGFTAPVSQYAYVDGKFDMMGNETTELDVDAVREAMNEMRGRVDSLVIAGYLSVRNPSHENKVRELANEILKIPVVCAHDLSSQLGFNERTNTAIINAGLIPTIIKLINAVKDTLDSFNIKAPLMIVKGDGSVMNSQTAVEKPVETILSGPAASLTGAVALTGEMNGIVIDMGGTTSDIGILNNGRPRTTENGADIEGHKTRIKAAEIDTYGVGGDSRIIVNGGEIRMLPTRSIPLCIASNRWPSIKERLERMKDEGSKSTQDYSNDVNIIQEMEFFIPASNKNLNHLSKTDADFVELLKMEPRTIEDASSILDIPKHSIAIGELIAKDYVTRIGLTPTDIIASQTPIETYDSDASAIAVEICSHKASVSTAEFIGRIHKIITDRISGCVMNTLLKDCDVEQRKFMIDQLLNRNDAMMSINPRLNVPLIGIGAPSISWLKDVADYFGCELILPENYDVANAVGTITGSVSETAVVTVKASPYDLSDDPECSVFSINGKGSFDKIDPSIDYAIAEGKRIAEEKAIGSGASEILFNVDVERISKDLVGDGIQRFREAIVRVTATGKPPLLRN